MRVRARRLVDGKAALLKAAAQRGDGGGIGVLFQNDDHDSFLLRMASRPAKQKARQRSALPGLAVHTSGRISVKIPSALRFATTNRAIAGKAIAVIKVILRCERRILHRAKPRAENLFE